MIRLFVASLLTVASLIACYESDDSDLPLWLQDLTKEIQQQAVTDPPTQIFQYDYNGDTVYYVPPRCCDIYSDLYDIDGVIICHPDGGITGSGDGRCPDFIASRTNEKLIWSDHR
jgi:hypothetical protein